jgi:hypothetical protein
VQADTGNAGRHDFEQCSANFARLQPETARKAIQFYRLRDQSSKPLLGDSRKRAGSGPVR